MQCTEKKEKINNGQQRLQTGGALKPPRPEVPGGSERIIILPSLNVTVIGFLVDPFIANLSINFLYGLVYLWCYLFFLHFVQWLAEQFNTLQKFNKQINVFRHSQVPSVCGQALNNWPVSECLSSTEPMYKLPEWHNFKFSSLTKFISISICGNW